MENTMIGKSLFIGERIEFTELDPEKDSVIFSSWTRQPAFTRKIFRQSFKPRPVFELKKKLQEILKEADENHQSIYFAIRKIGAPELIGLLWFPWVEAQHQTSRVHLAFVSDEDGDLFGAEALKMALYYAFMELSLHRVAVTLSADEPKMISLYEQFGFLREVQRREAVFSQGSYFDEYMYSLLKPEWKKNQSEGQA